MTLNNPKPVKISLHLIAKRHLPPDSSSWKQDKIVEALNNLTHLRLDRENICEIDHLELLGDHLTNIYLQNNVIQRIENLDFVNNVQFLTIAHNKLKKIEGIKQLKRLIFLDLSYNYIKDVDTDEIPPTVSLLNFKGNPCTERQNYRISLIQALERLHELDGRDVTTLEKRQAGYDVSSDEKDDDDEDEDDIGKERYFKEDTFSLTSGEMLLRSQDRMENSLLDHQSRRTVLTDLRHSNAKMKQGQPITPCEEMNITDH